MGQRFFPGIETWYASEAPTSEFRAVFEDDGETGYFYAYDCEGEARILDALHIYNAAAVVDGDRESVAEIVWSGDGMMAALLLNQYAHAVVDFAARCSYSRTGFPTAPENWRRGSWTDTLSRKARLIDSMRHS
jgi:hypothetical protein